MTAQCSRSQIDQVKGAEEMEGRF